MTRKLLGTETSNNNGEAFFTYLGNGEGKLKIIAESGGTSSVLYEICDCLYYDKAINGKKNEIYKVTGTLIVSDPDSNGTTLKEEEDTASQYYINSTTSINYFISGNFCLELYVDSFGGNPQIRVWEKNGTYENWDFSNKGVTQNCQLKIQFQNDKITYIIGDNDPVSIKSSINYHKDLAIAIRLKNNWVKYRDLKVYLI